VDRNLQKDHFVSKMGHFGPKNGHDTHIIKKKNIISCYNAGHAPTKYGGYGCIKLRIRKFWAQKT
jgi:hypothetical protein